MLRAMQYSPQLDRARVLGRERIAHVVLAELTRGPAGDIEVVIVERQSDVRHERRHGAESLEQWWKQLGVERRRRNRDRLLRLPLGALLVPRPHRRREVGDIDD